MKVTKRVLSWLLVVCTVVGLLPAIALTAGAIDSSATWTETAWANIANGATVIIANTNDVALPSTTASSSPAKTAITVSGSAGALKITPASGSLDDLAWTVNGSTTSSAGVQLLQYGSTTVNLYMASLSANTALRVGESDTNNLFVMGDGGSLLKVTSGSRYVGEYVAGSDWRTYNSETGTNYKGQSLKFYVLNSGSSSGGSSSGGGAELPDDGGNTGNTTTPSGVSDIYMVVNDASGLVVGETYIIVAATYDKAMSSYQKSTNRGAIEVVKDGDLLYCEGPGSDGYVLQEFTLGAGTVNGTYSFYDKADNGYIYAGSSTANQLKTEETLSANSSWLITFDEVSGTGTVATIKAQGANTRNYLQYNNSGTGLFACYTSKQQYTRIYRKAYSLVTDLSQLTIGDDIVIAASTEDVAMSITQNSNNRGQGAVTKTQYALVFDPAASIAEFTLGAGTTSGTYSFYDKVNGKYIYAASSGSNYLRSEDTLSANSSWKITVTEDGVATVLAQGANARNDLRYNNSSDIFACYASTSTSPKVAIYRRTATAAPTTTEYSVSFYVNGELESSTTTTGTVALPTASYSGWTFCGWVTEETDDLIDGTALEPVCSTGSKTVTADTDFYAVFVKDDTYTTRPTTETSGSTHATIKIITGEGTAYFSTDSGASQYGEAAYIKGTEAQVDVDPGMTLTIVIKPADGYRIACIEKSSNRLYASSDYVYDSTVGGYVYTFTTSATKGQNYFRISFLPRFSDGGYTATQITGWDNATASGLYVITGMANPEDYNTNNHDVATTYLLYGDDDTAEDDSYEAIGRKSSALQLGSIGVALNPLSPFMMSGLNETHLMEITRYGNTEYFTIRLYGATEKNHYIAARTTKAKENIIYTTESYLDGNGDVNNYALWKITYLDNGAVSIENHGWELAAAADTSGATATRYLKFNSANSNLQFRTYPATTTTVDFPVLYGASKSSYKVSYSVNGAGSISVINTTTSSTVPSGSYQATGSNITFTFAPASGYELASVTLNGVAVTVTDNSYTYTGLNKDIEVKVTYKEIPPATFTVQYFINESTTPAATRTVEAKTPYVLDTSVTVTYDGKTRPISDFSFDRATNGTETYPAVNSPITVKENDVVKAYFSTTAVQREKTVTEITQMGAADAALGGENSNWFTSANEQDPYTNVKQAYRVNLHVSSNDKIEEVKEGGSTDVIIVLDHSNSMYPPYTDNADYFEEAVSAFADVVFANGNPSKNRIAIVQYDTEARAWSGSALVKYAYSTETSAYSALTYNGCYMDTKSKVMTAFNEAMYDPDLVYTSGGTTNTMGGLRMTEVVAKLRPTNTTRNLVVIMFTDGLPTSRYYTSSKNYTWDGSGTRTSAWEFSRALEAGQSLRAAVDKYTKCESTIYNVALLNDEDMTAEDYLTADYFLDSKTVYRWSYDTTVDESKYQDLRNYVNKPSTYFKKTTPFADEYMKITGKLNDGALADLYEDIAYTYVAGQFVTGTITDVIPACFKLTTASKNALIKDGCTVTENADGTTTITKKVTANKDGDGFTYDIIYQGGGYGSIHTNESAVFAYTNLQSGNINNSYFPVPAATVIPWTVNDRQMAEMNVPTTIDILKNDLFTELTEGGYSLSDFTITLTDANGNPVTYKDAIEQAGCGFDAEVNAASNTVTFYTEKGGASTFYYVVSAKATAPDGTVTTVYSRATQVDVLVSKLDKYAQEVTNSTNLPAGVTVTKDEHGNVQQLYLITLTVNLFDIQNGKIVDIIPSDFEFVAYAQVPTGISKSLSGNTLTFSGINLVTDGVVISYYIRYTGTGYGAIPTNTSATLTYNQSGSSTTSSQEFPVPVAGVNPHTVNDVDITKTGTENTLDISANDLYSEAGMTVGGYTVTGTQTYLTDENGNRLTEEEIEALGITIVVNADGSITYIAPEEGVVQFYYVVESTVTVSNDGSYAKDNSVTLVSRPTLVTIFAVEDTFIVLDYGLNTITLDFIDYSDVVVAEGVLLEDILTTGSFNTTKYGVLTQNDNNTLSYKPSTMLFDQTVAYKCNLALAKTDYNQAKNVDLHFDIIPANNLYFEEEFISFDNAWVNEASANASATQNAGEYHNMQLHGFDDAYAAQEDYSNGNQMAVTVTKDDIEHTAFFTFAGTGFDIIGSTTPDSGVMVAQVYEYDANADDGCGKLIKNILVDTYLNGKSYHQIPVITYRSETYGIYRVKVRAFYNAIFDHNYVAAANPSASAVKKMLGFAASEELEIQKISMAPAKAEVSTSITTKALVGASNGQYNVYLDAVRIYNPLDTTGENAAGIEAAIYAAAGELNPVFININDALLDSENWGYSDAANGELAKGMIFVAADGWSTSSGAIEKYTGTYLSASGELYAQYDEFDGLTYLLSKEGRNLMYNGYLVYIKPIEAGSDTLASNEVKYFYCDDDGVEHELTKGQLRDLGVAFYDSKYEAVGPENEVYLKNNQGIALSVEPNVTIQVSMKVPFGTGYVTLQVFDTVQKMWREIANINSRTEMYYTINSSMIGTDGLLIMRCTVSGDESTVLSLCNVKIANASPVSTGGLKALTNAQAIQAIYAFEGDVETTNDPQLDEALAFNMDISAGAEMQVVYSVASKVVDAYEEFYLEVIKTAADGSETVTRYGMDSGMIAFNELKNPTTGKIVGYGATYCGINAKEMGDEFTAKLYVKAADGTVYCSNEISKSIKGYLMDKLNDANAIDELKTLAVDMLNYGAAAQINFNYNVENLVNADLTAEQIALGTQELPAAQNNIARSGDAAAILANVSLGNKVTLYLTAKYSEDAVFVIKDAATGEVIFEYVANKTNGVCQAIYDAVGAKQMREMITIELYNGDELVSETLTWSVESYVAQVREAEETSEILRNMVNAMLIYGDSVAAYFAAIAK